MGFWKGKAWSAVKLLIDFLWMLVRWWSCQGPTVLRACMSGGTLSRTPRPASLPRFACTASCQWRGLRKSWQEVGGSGRPKCTICGKTRNTVSAMVKHMKDHEQLNTTTHDSTQLHCALEEAPECQFQCASKNELERHIEQVHRSKNSLQCTVCTLKFINIDELSTHIDTIHKTTEETLFKCNRCGKSLGDKSEMNKHMNDAHKTYKPCSKFAADKCETSQCRFCHIKLPQNQHICFKCGKIFMSKTDIIHHIKQKHGKEICHRFLLNECSRSSTDCLFSHQVIEGDNLPNQDFQVGPPTILHSPIGGKQTMAEHIQNQRRLQKPHGVTLPMNIMNMIPQIVTQVVTLLTIQMEL